MRPSHPFMMTTEDQPPSPLVDNLDDPSLFINRELSWVHGRRRQLESGVLWAPPDGMTPSEQLAAIRRELLPELAAQMDCWQSDLSKALREADLAVLSYDELKGKQKRLLRRHFKREIFPALTPLAFDPGRPFPHIANLSMNLAVLVKDPVRGERFARLKVPPAFPRLLRVP